MSTDVATQQQTQVVSAPDNFISQAIQSNADADTLEKLFSLKERHDANEARKLFFSAMHKFQEIKPELRRSAEVSFGQGKTAYKFTPLSEIEKALREPLSKCGLSYRFENGLGENTYSVTCIVSHVDGHSERTTMTAPADSSGNKNQIQGIGSTSTYLMRYTLTAALGLTTADEDNDGATNSDLPYQRVLKQNEFLRDVNVLMAVTEIKQALEHEDYESAYEIMVNMPDDQKGALWIAPTRGGIFTTREIAQMKSNEFSAARKEYHSKEKEA